MALFDFAHMGNDFLKNRKGKNGEEEEEEEIDEGLPPIPVIEVTEDHMLLVEPDGFVDSDEDLDALSEASMDSKSSKASVWSRGKKKAKRIMSFRIKKSNKSETVKKTEPIYEPISIEASNAFSIQAHEMGFTPAFKMLKTMSRDNRKVIMEMLFIKGKDIRNDESDAYNILFTPIFGIRSRTNSALRQIGILKNSCWAHSLTKVSQCLTLSKKILLSSGDWRLPTRVTAKLSNKNALEASKELENSETMDSIEKKFYKKLQGVVEARLGFETSNAIREWVKEVAGEDLAYVFEETEKEQKKIQKQKSKHEKKLLKSSKKSKEVAADIGETDPEVDELEQLFQIRHIIQNIEKVKPGFGKFVILLMEILALRAKEKGGDFQYSDKKDMIKKLALVGAKDATIGLTVGMTLSVFVNPLLGLPLMGLSLTNLTLGSTEFNIIEPVCMMMTHSLILASNGTNINDFH